MKRFPSINARHRQIPEWILDCIQRIDEAKVRNHVEAFCEISPRCDELPASIHSTLASLKEALDQYGYHVQEERTDSEYQTNVIAERGPWPAQNAAKRFDSFFSEWKRQLEAGVEVT